MTPVLYPPSSPDWDELYSLDEALARDGEKLLQITGNDHGPWFYEDATGESHGPFYGPYEPFVPCSPCPCCDGAGEWDEGPLPASSGATEPEYRQVKCPCCEGTGLAESETRTLDDLDNEAMEQVEGRA